MKKRVLAIALILALCVGLLPVTASAFGIGSAVYDASTGIITGKCSATSSSNISMYVGSNTAFAGGIELSGYDQMHQGSNFYFVGGYGFTPSLTDDGDFTVDVSQATDAKEFIDSNSGASLVMQEISSSGGSTYTYFSEPILISNSGGSGGTPVTPVTPVTPETPVTPVTPETPSEWVYTPPTEYGVVVKYKVPEGYDAPETVTLPGLKVGTHYHVPSPIILGLTSDIPDVEGDITDHNVLVTVTYTKNATSGKVHNVIPVITYPEGYTGDKYQHPVPVPCEEGASYSWTYTRKVPRDYKITPAKTQSGVMGTQDVYLQFTLVKKGQSLKSAKLVGMKTDESGKVDDNAVYTEKEVRNIGLRIAEDGVESPLIKGKEYTQEITTVTEGGQSFWESVFKPVEGETVDQVTIRVKKAPENVHNVTVHYVYYGSNLTAAPSVTKSYAKGANFAIPSPKLVYSQSESDVTYYNVSSGYVVGTMGDTDLEYTVTYSIMTALAQFTVDVLYQVEGAAVAAPENVRQYKTSGQTYSISSPPLEGYKPDIQEVAGTVTNDNVIVTVTYKPQYTLQINYQFPTGAAYVYRETLPDGAQYRRESKDAVSNLPAAWAGTALAGASAGATADLSNVWTASPAVVEGTINGANVTVNVGFTCAHPGGNRYYVSDGDEHHHQECRLCNHEVEGSERVHTLGEGVYVPENEIPEGVEIEGRTTKKNGAKAYACTSGCGYVRYVDADAEICPASSKDDPQPHLWSIWTKISDTQCQRTCARCHAKETSGHVWGEWTSVSSATHSRMCSLCHSTETGSHGDWSNVTQHSPATCISNADVGATCGICQTHIEHVYFGLAGSVGQKYVALGHDFTGGYVNLHGGHTQQCARDGCTAFDMEHHEEHTYGEWYAVNGGEVQCGVPVQYRRDCTRCTAYETKTETREHNWVRDAAREVEATCEEAGTECYSCSQPGCTATNDKKVEALGHIWVENEGNYAATCLTTGHLDQYCTRCSAIQEKELPTLSPDGHHHYEKVTTSTATCTWGGDETTLDKCKYCGDEQNKTEVYVKQLGHSLKETEQRINWRTRLIYENGRPVTVDEEVFYVTRECTRCGYNAPGHIYTVARSGQLSRYKIETGDVKVREMGDGVKVTGQLGKDGGAYFNKTVDEAYKDRKNLDRYVYEQHDGSVIITFTPEFLNSLEDGDYEFILSNGDELSVATLTVSDHRIVDAAPGIRTDPDDTIEDGELLFYLGELADSPNVNVSASAIAGYTPYGPAVAADVSEFCSRAGSAGNKDVTVLTYDRGYELDGVTRFGEPLTEGVEYRIEHERVVLNKEYLATLNDGLQEFEFIYTDAPAAILLLNVDSVGPFADVRGDSWYYDAVYHCYDAGYFNGVSTTAFDPQGSMTRAMAATVLWNMEGRPAASGGVDFADVAADAWYYDAVRWASGVGIITGWTDDATGAPVFRPEDNVTREQYAAMLYRYIQCKGGGFAGMWAFPLDFADAADVADWAYESMCWMVMNGILNGVDGRLEPKGYASRAQVAQITMKYDKAE